jgi:hypothetical protein
MIFYRIYYTYNQGRSSEIKEEENCKIERASQVFLPYKRHSRMFHPALKIRRKFRSGALPRHRNSGSFRFEFATDSVDSVGHPKKYHQLVTAVVRFSSFPLSSAPFLLSLRFLFLYMVS